MKNLIWIFLVSISTNINALTVPFDNIQLGPQQSLSANYKFGNFNLIFCWEPSFQPVATLTWPYHSVKQSAVMPVSLKTNSAYQGDFADPSGTLSVRNNTNNLIIVNCDYAL